MVVSLNINEETYGMMLKTKRMLTASSKRSSATFQKYLPFLMRQRKDKMKRMETQFTESHPPGPLKVRPFLRSGLINENSQTVSVNSNVSIKKIRCLPYTLQNICLCFKEKKKESIYLSIKNVDF